MTYLFGQVLEELLAVEIGPRALHRALRGRKGTSNTSASRGTCSFRDERPLQGLESHPPGYEIMGKIVKMVTWICRKEASARARMRSSGCVTRLCSR